MSLVVKDKRWRRKKLAVVVEGGEHHLLLQLASFLFGA